MDFLQEPHVLGFGLRMAGEHTQVKAYAASFSD